MIECRINRDYIRPCSGLKRCSPSHPPTLASCPCIAAATQSLVRGTVARAGLPKPCRSNRRRVSDGRYAGGPISALGREKFCRRWGSARR
jgi:hypothetical protein